MESQQFRCSNARPFRSAMVGAALLAVVTAPGTCFHLWKWVTTGSLLALGEAMAILFGASLAGGAGGLVYQMVSRSKVRKRWKPLFALVAAMEAYLLTFSLIAVTIGWVTPHLNEGLPLGEMRFWIGLHLYGVLLCIVVWGVLFAPRLVQMIVGIVALIVLLLASFTMLSVLVIGPEHLDLWSSFLKPLSVVLQLFLVVLVLVSVLGWVRYLRGSRQAQYVNRRILRAFSVIRKPFE